MTQITYSQMPAAAALTGTEILPLDQGGVTSRSTINAVKTFLGGGANTVLAPPLNLLLSIPSATASATITADQLTLATALNGNSVIIASFSKTINLAVTGAGGMDTGVATAPGYIAVYAIYNTNTQTVNTLATLATSAVAPEIYGGANMPSGYTYSRLLTVLPLASTGNFGPSYQQNRNVWVNEVFLTPGFAIIGFTSVDISSAVPKNALTFNGRVSLTYTGSGGVSPVYTLSPLGSSIGFESWAVFNNPGGSTTTNGSFTVSNLGISTAQTTFFSITGQNFVSGSGFGISGYTF